MPTTSSHHRVAHDLGNAAPVTVPLPRTPGMDWPGEEPVVMIPAALLLSARGRCSCEECVEGFVRLMRRSRLQLA